MRKRNGLKFGMVDELAPKEYLLEIACQRAQKPVRAARRGSLKLSAQNTALAAFAIRKFLRPRLFQKNAPLLPRIRPGTLCPLGTVGKGPLHAGANATGAQHVC